MRVTVVPDDHLIRRDQDSIYLPGWEFEDSTIHAIQWYETEGEVEYKGYPKPANEVITDPAILAPYLAALDAALAAAPEPTP